MLISSIASLMKRAWTLSRGWAKAGAGADWGCSQAGCRQVIGVGRHQRKVRSGVAALSRSGSREMAHLRRSRIIGSYPL